MKEYKINQIRNLGLVGHGGVGKTALAEALLFSAGITTRLGRVEDGNTVSDYSAEEISRKISIAASLLHLDWNNYKINLVDLPGYADFIGEVVAGLRVTETSLILISALSGVEVGTEQVWKTAEKYDCTRMFFINKMEKEHASFSKVSKQLQDRFGSGVVAVQLPLDEGLNFKGVIDLIQMKSYFFQKEAQAKEDKIPADLESQAQEAREKMMEAIAESDDTLLEKFFDKGELTEEEIKLGLKKGITERKIFPLLCGAATENWGTNLLLDFATEYLPSPADFVEVKGIDPNTKQEIKRKIAVEEPTCAFVFKTVAEPHVGELSFFKVYAGKISPGNDLLNPTKQVTERIGQIYVMNGKERKEIGNISAGDLGAFVKLKSTHTGDTLCDKKHPILLPPIDFPKPVINMAIKPKNKGDEEKIANGFAKLHEEDPTFIMVVDGDIRQTIIYGQGELHLEIMVDKLKKKFGVEAELEKPRIPYRETIKAKAEAQGKYKRQSGGRGQYGDAWLRVEPLHHGEGFQFVDDIVGGAVPSKYIPAVEKGVVEAMHEGILAGYKMVDIKVSIYDGTYHVVDSSDMAFKIAGSMGFRKAALEAKPVLLEPIYNVEVIVPSEFMGDVMGDISSRRGKIMGMEADGGFEKIKAKVPLAELYKYSTSLRSHTQGRGHHTREFSHYEEVPREIAEKIIKEAQDHKQKEKEEE